MNSTKIRASAICPVCKKNIYFGQAVLPADMTTDCSHCGATLWILNNVVYPFHEKMHELEPSWPKDGQGTGHILLLPRQEPEDDLHTSDQS